MTLYAWIHWMVAVIFFVGAIVTIYFTWRSLSNQEPESLAHLNTEFQPALASRLGALDHLRQVSGSSRGSLNRTIEDILLTPLVRFTPDLFDDLSRQEAFQMVHIAYSDLEQSMFSFRSALEQSIKSMSLGKSMPYEALEFTDITFHDSLAMNQRVLCTFPFFLSELRRSLWAVIPYAHHRRFGVMLHRDNPVISELPATNLAQQRTSAATLEIHKWWNRLLIETRMNNGRLLIPIGFLEREIIPLFLKSFGSAESRSAYFDVRSVVAAPSHHANERASSSQSSVMFIPGDMHEIGQVALTLAKSGPDKRRFTAFIFDLAYRRQVEAEIPRVSPHLKIVEIPHLLDVPVGIGLSHLMVPSLTRSGYWDKLQSDAIQLLRKPECQDLLNGIGVEFDQDVKRNLVSAPKPGTMIKSLTNSTI